MSKPCKYSEDELINLVCDLVLDEPNIKLTPTTLEKKTGIPKHIWKSKSYKRLQDTITTLSRTKPIESKIGIIDNPAMEIEQNIDSPERLISIGENLNVLINELYEQIEYYRSEYAKIRKENESIIRYKEVDDTDTDLCELIELFESEKGSSEGSIFMI